MEEVTENTASEENDIALIDEAMLGMGEFVSQMTDVEGDLSDEETQTALRVESVSMSMPIQLDLLVEEDGGVILGASPPIYYTETTFMPVFHQLTINLMVEEERNR
jgi:hypothetical protein